MPALALCAPLLDFNDAKSHGRRAKDLLTTIIREGGQDGDTRFRALSKIIGHWIRMARQGGCTLSEAWVAVADQNAATIRPPRPEDRLRREFEALLKVDMGKRGPMPSDTNLTDAAASAPELSEDALAQEFIRQLYQAVRRLTHGGFPKRQKSESMAVDQGGRGHGCSDSIAGGL